MSLRKYANKRDTVEKGIVDALRKAGCTVYLTDKPMDALIGFRSRTYIGEFKDPKKKNRKHEYTPDQLKFMDEWRGGPVVTLRSPQDAINWINCAKEFE